MAIALSGGLAIPSVILRGALSALLTNMIGTHYKETGQVTKSFQYLAPNVAIQRHVTCVHKLNDNYAQINGQLTLGENIADNGGVHTAFRAYKNMMRGVSEQYVKGHSGDQLFFVAFAQVGSLQHSHWYHLFVHIYSSGVVDLLVKLWRRQ